MTEQSPGLWNTAGKVIESFGKAPALLAILLVNLVFIWLVLDAVKDAGKQHHMHLTALLQACVEKK